MPAGDNADKILTSLDGVSPHPERCDNRGVMMKIRMANRFINLFLLMAWMLPSTVAAITVAKYAGEFISTGVGARALGMGGAHVAVGTDITAGYWNPAGLIGLRFPQLMLMHSSRFNGIVKYDYAAVGLPSGRYQTFAISLTRLGVDDIPITALTDPSLPLSETNQPYVKALANDAEYALYLSYARLLVGKLSYGVNVKLLHKGVGSNSAYGLGFDVGILINPWKKLLAGVNLQDVTTTILAWDTRHHELISPTLKLGCAYPFEFALFGSKIMPAFDVDLRFENRRSAAQMNLGPVSFDTHLGLEYALFRIISLRVGTDTGHFTAGTGIRLPQLQLDYAFMSHDLGATHRLSLRVSIEKGRFKRL